MAFWKSGRMCSSICSSVETANTHDTHLQLGCGRVTALARTLFPAKRCLQLDPSSKLYFPWMDTEVRTSPVRVPDVAPEQVRTERPRRSSSRRVTSSRRSVDVRPSPREFQEPRRSDFTECGASGVPDEVSFPIDPYGSFLSGEPSGVGAAGFTDFFGVPAVLELVPAGPSFLPEVHPADVAGPSAPPVGSPDDSASPSTDEPGKQVRSAVRIKNTSKSHVVFKFQTTAPKSCFMRPPGGTLAPGESIVATVFKFVEHPVNNEKPLHLKSQIKFKIMSLKVKGRIEYVPELFDEQKDEVLIEQILSVVLFYADRPNPHLDKLKNQLAEADAALEARKKPPEDTGPRVVGEGLVIDEWKERREKYLAKQQIKAVNSL